MRENYHNFVGDAGYPAEDILKELGDQVDHHWYQAIPCWYQVELWVNGLVVDCLVGAGSGQMFAVVWFQVGIS